LWVVGKELYATLLAPGILRRLLLHFWNSCVPLLHLRVFINVRPSLVKSEHLINVHHTFNPLFTKSVSSNKNRKKILAESVLQPPKAEDKVGWRGGGRREPTPAYFLQCEATTKLYPMVLLLLYCFCLPHSFCLVVCLPVFVPFLWFVSLCWLYNRHLAIKPAH